MKVVAINGSPRKEWNTAALLKSALEGAAAQGAQTELVHLYDHRYTGCISCFACKRADGKSYGKCAVNDDLREILRVVGEADALILGSPLYFGGTTGEMRSFLERLMFQHLIYDANYSSLCERHIPVAFFYTMNVPQTSPAHEVYRQSLAVTEWAIERTFGNCEVLEATDTYQFDDYGKYETSAFDAQAKAKRRAEVFPQDCARAYEIGARFAKRDGT